MSEHAVLLLQNFIIQKYKCTKSIICPNIFRKSFYLQSTDFTFVALSVAVSSSSSMKKVDWEACLSSVAFFLLSSAAFFSSSSFKV